MFTVGIDFGGQNTVVAVAQKKGVDIISNAAGYRKTFNGVGYGREQRALGDAAQTTWTRNVKDTVVEVKTLLGRRYSDPEVQRNLPFLCYKVEQLPGDQIGIRLSNGEVVTPVQVTAAMLGHLSRTTEASQGSSVTDVVVAVPGWWGDAQRRALRTAARAAGMGVLSLIDELTAVALQYGLTKCATMSATDASDTERIVAFVDVGYTATQASVVRFTSTGMRVLATAYDQSLGGRELDRLLFEHFRRDFDQRYKMDIGSNAKASLRLRQACQKVKHVLTANPKAPLNIECLLDDKDVSGMVDRAALEAVAAPLLARLTAPLERAMEAAGGLTPDALYALEVVGDAHRPPSFRNVLSAWLGEGREVSRTLPAAEAVARGAAWQCARLSPIFRVRDYDVADVASVPLQASFSWVQSLEDAAARAGTQEGLSEPEGGPAEEGAWTALVNPTTPKPKQKVITLPRSELPATASNHCVVRVKAAPGHPLPEGSPAWIGAWRVGPVPPNADGVHIKPRLRLCVKVDASGMFSVLKAEKLWEEEKEVEEEVDMSPEEVAAAEAAEAAAGGGDAGADDAAAAPSDEAAPGTPEVEMADAEAKGGKKAAEPKKAAPAAAKKKRTKKVKVTKALPQSVKVDVTQVWLCGHTAADGVAALAKAESDAAAADRAVVEREEARNAVEAYVYETRGKLFDAWYDFVASEQRDAFKQQLDQTLDWLYDQPEDAPKEVFATRGAELRAVGDPIKERASQAEERPHASSKLEACLAQWEAWVAQAPSDDATAHIPADKLAEVSAKVGETRTWLAEQLAAQDAKPKHEDVVLRAEDIVHRQENVEAFARAIAATPKPKPKPKEGEGDKGKAGNGDAKGAPDAADADGNGAAGEGKGTDGDASAATDADAKAGDAMDTSDAEPVNAAPEVDLD